MVWPARNRIHLYAKGLKEQGNDILFIIPRPTEDPGKINNSQTEGIYEDIKYQYAYKSTTRSKSFWGRRNHDIIFTV
jgi:hypothetical protein